MVKYNEPEEKVMAKKKKSKRKGLTTSAFLKRLRAKVDAQAAGFVVQEDGEIRWGEDCPITFVAGEVRGYGWVDEAIEELGLSERDSQKIIDASDEINKSTKDLRIKLLEAVGLL
jgi:hypothetical protein